MSIADKLSSPRGLGDVVSNGLSAMGITKTRVSVVTQAVIGRDCNCGPREATLNKWFPNPFHTPAEPPQESP